MATLQEKLTNAGVPTEISVEVVGRLQKQLADQISMKDALKKEIDALQVRIANCNTEIQRLKAILG